MRFYLIPPSKLQLFEQVCGLDYELCFDDLNNVSSLLRKCMGVEGKFNPLIAGV